MVGYFFSSSTTHPSSSVGGRLETDKSVLTITIKTNGSLEQLNGYKSVNRLIVHTRAPDLHNPSI